MRYQNHNSTVKYLKTTYTQVKELKIQISEEQWNTFVDQYFRLRILEDDEFDSDSDDEYEVIDSDDEFEYSYDDEYSEE